MLTSAKVMYFFANIRLASHLSIARLMSDSPDCGSFESPSQEQNSRADRGVKVKMVARGFSAEGNKLLDYLVRLIGDRHKLRY